MTHRRHAGFTLLELLMVVIIIAILVAIALPKFVQATQKAQAAQAMSWLGAVRSSQMRYLGTSGVGYTSTLAELDITILQPPLFNGSGPTFSQSGSGVAAVGSVTLTHDNALGTVGITYGSGTLCGTLANKVDPVYPSTCTDD